jgi:hypothetical protein
LLLFLSSDGRADIINIARRYYYSFLVHDCPLNPNLDDIISSPPSHAAIWHCCPHACVPAPRCLTASTAIGSTPASPRPSLGPHRTPAPPPRRLHRCQVHANAVSSPTIAAYLGPPHSLPLSIIYRLEN